MEINKEFESLLREVNKCLALKSILPVEKKRIDSMNLIFKYVLKI